MVPNSPLNKNKAAQPDLQGLWSSGLSFNIISCRLWAHPTRYTFIVQWMLTLVPNVTPPLALSLPSLDSSLESFSLRHPFCLANSFKFKDAQLCIIHPTQGLSQTCPATLKTMLPQGKRLPNAPLDSKEWMPLSPHYTVKHALWHQARPSERACVYGMCKTFHMKIDSSMTHTLTSQVQVCKVCSQRWPGVTLEQGVIATTDMFIYCPAEWSLGWVAGIFFIDCLLFFRNSLP